MASTEAVHANRGPSIWVMVPLDELKILPGLMLGFAQFHLKISSVSEFRFFRTVARYSDGERELVVE